MTPKRCARLTSVLDRRQPDLTVVLENVFDPHNVSAVMRTCDAVGIQEIYILNNRIPPHKQWGYRSSSTANKWLTIHQFTDVNECFSAIRKKFSRIYATHLNNESVKLHDLDLTEPVALVFGNERFGVNEEILKLVDGNFIIPQVGIIKSLNISVACAVSLYEAYRQKSNAGHYEQPKLPEEMRNKLIDEWKIDF